MNVLLMTPWDNAWIPHFKRAFEKAGCRFRCAKNYDVDYIPDVVIHGWASGDTQPFPDARNIMFLRRYELFSGGLAKVDWSEIDALICVNEWIAERVKEVFKERKIDVPVSVIYNATDSTWNFKRRAHGQNIGMACHVHPKKNLPLALQILAALPDGYELHIAGDIQDACTAEYLNHAGKAMKRRVYLYGHIEHAELDLWWERMNYCLSASISEGNPNNVIEAMKKGIKPLVHNWPGAQQQFAPWIFNNVGEAVKMVMQDGYNSDHYANWVAEKFSLANIEQVVELALQTNELEAA